MNTATTTRLTHAVMIAAALAAVFIARSAHAAPADAPQVVTMPRVMVTGKRIVEAPAGVVVMPRVVVTGRRIDAQDTMQARRQDTPAKRV